MAWRLVVAKKWQRKSVACTSSHRNGQIYEGKPGSKYPKSRMYLMLHSPNLFELKPRYTLQKDVPSCHWHLLSVIDLLETRPMYPSRALQKDVPSHWHVLVCD